MPSNARPARPPRLGGRPAAPAGAPSPGDAPPLAEVDALLSRAAYVEALAVVQPAAERFPRHPGVQLQLGIALRGAGRRKEAVEVMQRAVGLAPHAYETNLHLAHALLGLGRGRDAVAYYRAAVTAQPRCAISLANLSHLLTEEGELLEAVRLGKQALEADPSHLSAWINTGAAFAAAGHYGPARQCAERAACLAPQQPRPAYNLATLQMLHGEFAEGWANYEARRFLPGLIGPARAFASPAWDGSDPAGRRILLHAEQGFGDQIQFARYAAALQARGATVVLEVDPPLVRLLRTTAGADEVIARGEPLPPHDAHLPLLSAPHLLRFADPAAAPGAPYLQPPGPAPAALDTLLPAGRAPGEPLRVGLTWAGSPLHRNDRNRSVALTALQPLLDVPGVRWVSLQKGPGQAQLDAAPAELREQIADVGTLCDDFGDTAHALARLDLLIAVDTATAHLAGALGVPTWLLLPFAPDWRWQLHRTDSPWYPGMALFRQPAAGAWGEPVAAMAAALRERVAGG